MLYFIISFQAWQKPKYRHRAQDILRLVDRMNNLTLWVATTILSQKDIQQRAKRITDFILISIVSIFLLYISHNQTTQDSSFENYSYNS